MVDLVSVLGAMMTAVALVDLLECGSGDTIQDDGDEGNEEGGGRDENDGSARATAAPDAGRVVLHDEWWCESVRYVLRRVEGRG